MQNQANIIPNQLLIVGSVPARQEKGYVFVSSSTTLAILSTRSLRVFSFSFAVLLKLFDFVIHTSLPVSSAFCPNASADLTGQSTSASKRLLFF